MTNLKCDDCGVFISFDDLANNRATHDLEYPSSDLTEETWLTLCPKHTLEYHASLGIGTTQQSAVDLP